MRVASLFSGCGGLDLGLEQVEKPEKVLIADLCLRCFIFLEFTSTPVAPLRPMSQAGHEVILLCEKDPGAIQVSGKPWGLGNTSE
jgi:hypothetical protein